MLMQFRPADIPATLPGHDELVDCSGLTNVFFNVPIDSISHSTILPDFRNLVGSEANNATPGGVPVMAKVPAASVVP